MHHKSACALLRVNLELFGKAAADPFRPEQAEKSDLVFHIGAGGIAEAVAATAVMLGEKFSYFPGVLIGDVQLLTNSFMPVFCQGFRCLDAEPVQVEIFRVVVCFKKFLGSAGDFTSDGYTGHGDSIRLVGINGAEIVSNAKVFSFLLTREGEAFDFCFVVSRIINYEAVTFASAAEVAINDVWLQDGIFTTGLLKSFKNRFSFFPDYCAVLFIAE